MSFATNYGSSTQPNLFALWRSLAEGEGFEPPNACTSPVFKTGAINHSANPPDGNSVP